MEYNIFISYSRYDKEIVHSLYNFLEGQFQHRVQFWIDTTDIEPSDVWNTETLNAIKSCKLVLAFLSQKACLSRYVREELVLSTEQKKRVIPIIIDRQLTDREVETAIPAISGLHYINATGITDGIKAIEALEEVVEVIRKQYGMYLSGEVTVFESIEPMLHDLVNNRHSKLDMFFIDGGTTLRRFLTHGFIDRLLHQVDKGLSIRFLFVDLNCKNMVGQSLAGRTNPDCLSHVKSDAYQVIFEGLLQGSRWIHNNGPHDVDVVASLSEIERLAASNGRVTIAYASG